MDDNFYKIPFSFFENEKYDDLTATEKLMYSVLYARSELSKKKKIFQDEDGIFVNYTVDGLMKYMKIGSNTTVIKALKNLESHGLLIRKKGKANQPDKVYIKEVEIKDNPQKKTNEQIDKIFANLSPYLTVEEKKRFENLLLTLAMKKRDAYKIGDKYIATDMILSRVLMLETSEIIEVFRRMREKETEIKNYFIYLATALYNAYNC